MLRLDYEALAEASMKLREQGEIFADCIETMSTVVDGLADIWEAETCDKYVEQYGEAKPTLDAVRELIEAMAEQMQKISDNFAAADSEMAGQM
ncbi:MAG: WXG100 family type VII secretion target [Lachnospiraceae bacterium]